MMMVVVVVSHGEIVSHGRFVVVVLLGPVSFQFSSVLFCFVFGCHREQRKCSCSCLFASREAGFIIIT